MNWTLIQDDSGNNIKTYAYMIDRIGCMVLVQTANGSTMTLANGVQIVDNRLVAMDGYGIMPEEDYEYDDESEA